MSMNGRVKLGFDGNFYQGFEVELELGLEGQLPDVVCKGYLPANLGLVSKLHQWRQIYRGLSCSNNRIQPGQIVYGGSSIQQHQVCLDHAQALSADFQQWLQADSFREICDRVREKLNPNDEIRMLLSTDSPELRQLPWQQWNLLDRYSHAEVALSPSIYERQFTQIQPFDRERVQILAILGNSTGIDIEADQRFLQNLPNTDITFLNEPSREELQDALYNHAWDILFFAGHGYTAEEQGYIHLNPTDQLSIKELKHALKAAISKGLQLAIFNSCDGLGLATDLELLNLPQLVVMREPVPDKVAQQFLKHFLKAYSVGYPLHLAVRDAREKLHILEKEYPCASWLPTLFQHPTAEPPTWNSFRGRTGGRIAGEQWNRLQEISNHVTRAMHLGWRHILTASLIIAIISTTFVNTVGSNNALQSAELKVFDYFMRLRPAEEPDDRFLIVTVSDADKKYQDAQGMRRQGSLSDEAILKILDITQNHPPRIIATNIFHDFSYQPELAQRLEANGNFVAACQGTTGQNPVGSGPPPLPEDSTISFGFTDLLLDIDGVARRQIIGMSSAEPCDTPFALSTQVALAYLQTENPELELVGNRSGVVEIGEKAIPQLHHQFGGYRVEPKIMAGYQVLINYRPVEPHQISLTSFLNGSLSPEDIADLVDGKIVLIGLADSPLDFLYTPYTTKYQTPEISIHVQMASQIISLVLDDRDLIRDIPQWAETLWVAFWAFLGAVLVLKCRFPFVLTAIGLVGIAFLFFCGYFLLINSFWIPSVITICAFLSSIVIAKFYSFRCREST